MWLPLPSIIVTKRRTTFDRQPNAQSCHNTKWTSDKTGQMLSEGYKAYQKRLVKWGVSMSKKRLGKWCRQLKSMSKQLPDTEEPKGYELLRVHAMSRQRPKH
eukprot:scaffold68749_cov111-Cyclotella_meneghiniana.AAC.1